MTTTSTTEIHNNNKNNKNNRNQSLKNTCITFVANLITSGQLLLPTLQILGSDILEQILHYLHSEQQLTSDELILSLITPNLHNLNLSLCHNLQDKGFESILQKCPQLHLVTVSSCRGITNDGIKMIGKYCPQLEVLNIANCHTITSDSIGIIVDSCPNIHSFNIAGCWALDDYAMEHLGRIRHQLQYVNICGCKLISNIGVSAMLGNDPMQTFQPNCYKTCRSLYSFQMSTCKPNISTSSVLEIAMAAPNLTSLNIGGIKNLDNKAIVSLAENCANLRELLAGWCPITDASMTTLAEKCTTLELLNLSGCNRIGDGTCTALTQHCHSLTKLNLSSTKISFPGLSKLIDTCANLQSLDVRLCKFTSAERDTLNAITSFHVKV